MPKNSVFPGVLRGEYHQRSLAESPVFLYGNIFTFDLTGETATIGFEKQIWDAAYVLRRNVDASEYKNVVLGLIFLKYISDRFDDKYQKLVEEGDGEKK